VGHKPPHRESALEIADRRNVFHKRWRIDTLDPGATKEITVSTRTLSVPEISCGHCKSSIEGAVSPLDGVEKVEVHIEERTVALDYDGSDSTFEAIVAAIEEEGYAVPDQN
jgi:copper chaperone